MQRSVCLVSSLIMALLVVACGDDDGGQNNNNTPQPVCGNALIEQGEVCDGVNVGLETCVSQGFSGGGTLACNSACSGYDTSLCIPDQANCGNNTIDFPETCDGNDLNSQTCSSVGNFTGGNLACNSTCSGWDTTGCTNTSVTCGNNLAEGTETCDGTDLKGQSCTTVAGSFTGGTLACNGSCTGFVTTGCTTDPICGDDTAEGSEVCDGADLKSNDCTTISGGFTAGILACNSNCDGWDTSQCWTMPADCGNGAIDGSEVCDGANLNSQTCVTLGYAGGSLLCAGDCSAFIVNNCNNTAATCGNGFAEPSEQCDGADLKGLSCLDLDMTGGTLACNSDCSLDLSSCTGDMCTENGWYSDGWCDPCEAYGGHLDPDCLTYCFLADGSCDDWDDPLVGGSSCMYALGRRDPDCGTCGDGTIDSDFEQCDGSATISTTCEDLGFAPGGSLGCDNKCVLLSAGCTATTCGDSNVEGWEQCDTANLDSNDCSTVGFTDGTLGCHASGANECTFDTSGCWLCGNDTQELSEVCDGADVNGNHCTDYGFGSGTLGCSSQCDDYDFSQCVDGCGNGVTENAEVCDGDDVGSDTCITEGHDGGSLMCNAGCTALDTSVCVDNYTTTSVTYNWIDITGTGTTTASLTDDSYDGPLTIGFDFPFYGQAQTELYITSNALLTFGAGSTTFSNTCSLPSTSLTMPFIAVMWDDLNPAEAASGDIYYQSFGSCPWGSSGAECFVVTWDNMIHYSAATVAGTFQAILFANGSVLMQYADGGAEEGLESTTGVQWDGDANTTYACDTAASLTDNLAVCFVADGSGGCQ